MRSRLFVTISSTYPSPPMIATSALTPHVGDRVDVPRQDFFVRPAKVVGIVTQRIGDDAGLRGVDACDELQFAAVPPTRRIAAHACPCHATPPTRARGRRGAYDPHNASPVPRRSDHPHPDPEEDRNLGDIPVVLRGM